MGSKENLSLTYRDFSKDFQADMAKEWNVLEKNRRGTEKTGITQGELSELLTYFDVHITPRRE